MEAGQRVRDFILEEKIGAGGVGEVWRARHQYLDTLFAIKVIFRHLSQDVHFQDRFQREAVAMASLKEHPHIVTVHDFFSLEGASYLVMSYIEGGSLEDHLKQDGRLPLKEALRIANDILDALDFAHAKGVIHRDVKPSNILLGPDGQAYLADFGIALVLGKPRITQFGINIGTPAYMSPEQIKAQELDHRTDVYSFGCVLYEMLAGRPPFGSREEGKTEYEIMRGHVEEAPPSLRQINREVDAQIEAIVFRALAKDPNNRYGGCRDMAKALSIHQGSSSDRTAPSPAPPTPPKPMRRSLFVILGILFFGAFIALWLIRQGPEPEAPRGKGGPAPPPPPESAPSPTAPSPGPKPEQEQPSFQPPESSFKFTEVTDVAKYTDKSAVEVSVPVSQVSHAFLDGHEVSVSSDSVIRLTVSELPLGTSSHTLRLSGSSASQFQDVPITVTYYPGWEVRQFTDTREEAYGVAFAPDGQTVISATGEKTLSLWDVATGQKIRTLSGHRDWVTGVAFSPDGKMIASCSDDKTVRLWDVTTGRTLRTLSGHSNVVNRVAFSPDGRIVASASTDGTVKLWEVATGKAMRTLSGHKGWVITVAFAPAGQTIVSGSDDRTLRLWNVKTGKTMRIFSGHQKTVFGVAFSPDGKMIVSGGHDNMVKLWDVATGGEVRTFAGHSDWVNGVAFSPGGKLVVSGGKDKTVKLWDVATGQEIRTFVGHRSTVTGVAFSPDGKTVISSSRDTTLRLWWAAVEPGGH